MELALFMEKVLIRLYLLLLLLYSIVFLIIDASAMRIKQDIVNDGRTIGEGLDDYIDVNAIRLRLLHYKSMYQYVHVHIFEGRILLTGMVMKEEDNQRLERFIWAMPRVTEIINKTIIKNPPSRYRRLHGAIEDLWINCKIRVQIFLKNNIKVHYGMTVYGCNVYFIGLASQNNEIEQLLITSSNVVGVHKVYSFIILKKDERRNKRLI